MFAFLVAAFMSIFTIVNPFSTASVFLGLAGHETHAHRVALAKRACIAAASLLITFALLGSTILTFFSITIDAFRIAGGLLIAAVGWQMVRATRERLDEEGRQEALSRQDISIVPLAIPLLSGPGSITTVLILASEAPEPFGVLLIIAAIIAVCLVSYFVLSRADVVVRYIGETGADVIEKVMGLIVMVVGVQFMINGVRSLLMAWGIV